jgi:hypothetical protein
LKNVKRPAALKPDTAKAIVFIHDNVDILLSINELVEDDLFDEV